jgi:DNA-directed RNA polymerase subunit RPC12/RpoP
MTEADLRTDSSQYNSRTKASQLIHEIKNATENYDTLYRGYMGGRVRDISAEPKADGKPCLIIGSGGSLDLALPYLKDWKGGIICTTSHALTLVKHGAPPTHILALDPFCIWDEIAGIDWTQYGTKLITTPTVWTTLVQTWPNEILLYRQNIGRRDSFYANALNQMYCIRKTAPNNLREGSFEPMVRTELTLFACSPPAQLFAAQVLGYGNMFLVGCDFAFSYDKDRFTNWTIKDGEWTEHKNPLLPCPPELGEWTYTMNGIPSAPVHVYYKKNMISAWRLSGQDCWVTGLGAITEMPYCDIRTVIHKQGQHIKGISKQEAIRRAEEYLAMVGAFVICPSSGMAFVEANNPMTELGTYMAGMNRQYKCAACHADLSAPDDKDATGQPCPACKEGKIARANYVDIDANLKRIADRLKAAEKLKQRGQHASRKAANA